MAEVQLTVRYDEELAEAIDSLAAREGISKNRAILRLAKAGAGLEEGPPVVGSSLDWFIGSWSAEDEAEFTAATADLRRIDPDLWK